MLCGAALLLIGLCYPIPSEELTTYENLSGYSYVEEYMNGDAYNYIIASSLIGGKIAGALALKGVFIAAGVMIICMGLVNYRPNSKEKNTSVQNEGTITNTLVGSENSLGKLPDVKQENLRSEVDNTMTNGNENTGGQQ